MLLAGAPLNGTPAAVGGYAGVKLLQEELQRISGEFGKPSADPAQYDGTMTMGTLIALGNAAPIVGNTLHPAIGESLRVIDLIKAPIKKLPYGDTIIELILSPWIIDEIYDALLGIIRLIPGGGGVASSIDKAVTTAKQAIANAAAPLGGAFKLIKKSGLGDLPVKLEVTRALPIVPAVTTPLLTARPPEAAVPAPSSSAPQTTASNNPPPGYTWDPTPVGHWERLRAGQVPMPAPGTGPITTGTVRDQRRTGSERGSWPAGRAIVPANWSRAKTYYAKVPFENLSLRDQQTWTKYKNVGFNSPFGSTFPTFPALSVRRGTIAFMTFDGSDGSRMGAFWSEQTEMLKIASVPRPSSSKYPWDYVADAVVDAANTIADIAQDSWNWIADNADDVYRAVKKYGCMIVNNDILIAVAATGAGIVATPATSAAIVTGAQAGKGACAVMEVAEALYAIYKLLSMEMPKMPESAARTAQAAAVIATSGVVRQYHVAGQVVLPLTPPIVGPAKSLLPVGSVAAYDPILRRYRIAVPKNPSLPGPTPGGYVEVERSPTPPLKIPVVTLAVLEQGIGSPLHKRLYIWQTVGGGVALGALGSYLLRRR